MRITIAGTAGRKEDSRQLSKEIYTRMCETTLETIVENCPKITDKIMLVSGGAAYADHIAILLYLEHPELFELTLYLPAEFQETKFKDTGEFNWKTNPGGTSNYYHRRFQSITGHKSFEEMQRAISKGAKVNVSEGFFARNNKMADSEIVIALTFGKGAVKAGGTKNMVETYLKKHQENPMVFHIGLPTCHIQKL